MDANRINAKIYAGRGKAALRLGYKFDVFRPADAINPLANSVATIHAAFNAKDNDYLKPNGYGSPLWFVDVDARNVAVGDYLVREFAINDNQLRQEIYFVASKQSLLPIQAIECNSLVRVIRQNGQAGVGALGYNGLCGGTELNSTALIGGKASNANIPASYWPASILLGGKANSNDMTPSSVKNAGWRILLPASLPVQLKSADIVLDNNNKKFIIEAAELTDMGWRINAQEAHL